jgi:hypothetical protein
MNVYLTIDTELTSGLYRTHGAGKIREIFDRSIWGKTPEGDVGIGYQMGVLDRHGLKAVFFVDPMPALLFGVQLIRDIVQPILERGHDVQLHMHSEWLQYVQASPLNGRLGNNIKSFSLEDQSVLIRYARDVLMEAGAPAPVAFRAGNYGANDDTLRALALNNIQYDTSFCPGIAKSACDIGLPHSVDAPLEHCGTIEVPIGAIRGPRGRTRHAQLTALSTWEMLGAIEYSQKKGKNYFTLVSHSFELMSRDRLRVNRIVRHRFEKLCAALARMKGIKASTYRDNPPFVMAGAPSALLPHRYVRTFARTCEQAASNYLYG